MTKSQKPQQEREPSQPSRKYSPLSQGKKKDKNRSLTDYFSKIEVAPQSKEAPIAAQSQLARQKNKIFEGRKEEIQLRITSQKQQHQQMMSMVRTAIIKQLKTMAQIDRITAQHHSSVLDNRLNTLAKQKEKMNHLKRLIQTDNASPMQLHFLLKELAEVEQAIRRLEFEVLQMEEEQRLRQEEDICFLTKQQWPLISKRYQPLRLVGKGGFSQVYEAHDLDSHTKVAVKLSDVDHLLGSRGDKEGYLRHIKREYEVHKRMNHPNIVKLIDVTDIDSAICIVLQHCEGPTLAQLIKKQGKIPEKEAKMVVQQLLSVILYLSQQRVVHYDLKPQNIMFDQGVPKVLDFGICKTFDSEHSKMLLTSQGMGTYCYLPPETFMNPPILTNKVDIWSLGVLFYEMLNGQRPPNSQLNPNRMTNYSDWTSSYLSKSFISGCLETEIGRRLDPEQAVRHPYFQQ